MRGHQRTDRLLGIAALAFACGGCQGSLLFGGISFAPWLGCLAVGSFLGYVVARILEARLFNYDPRYFVWTLLPLATLFSILLWGLVARPPPG